MGRGVNDGSFYESGRETEGCISVMRQRKVCVRGNVFLRREMVGERRVVVCFLFSFVPANSPLYTPSPQTFWSQDQLGLDFSFGQFMHLFICSFTKLLLSIYWLLPFCASFFLPVKRRLIECL